MSTSFRFETYENVIAKHTLSKTTWSQVAQYAFNQNLSKRDYTLAGIRMIDEDTIEIIKRRDQNKSICYKMGYDQKGWYERVIINRKDQTVAIDRLDVNWLNDEPFLGQRDLFMPSKRAHGSIDFVRHLFWIHKATKMCEIMGSHWSAWSYRRAFRNNEDIKARN